MTPLGEVHQYVMDALSERLVGSKVLGVEFFDNLRRLDVSVVPLDAVGPHPRGRLFRRWTPSKDSIGSIPRSELDQMLNSIAADANAPANT